MNEHSFQVGDIVTISDLKDRLFKINNINMNNIEVQDIIIDSKLLVSIDAIKKFDTKTLNLSEPYLLVLLIDAGMVEDTKVIKLYNQYHFQFLEEHSKFIDFMKKRKDLEAITE
jgi:hypothetical protein